MRFLFLLFIICCFTKVKAQTLFYQNTFKGGISVDGVSHNNIPSYLAADTFVLANTVPIGATIKKAFLFMTKFSYVHGTIPPLNNKFQIKLNGTNIILDSTSQTTNFFNYDYLGLYGKSYVVSKEVTSQVLHSNNAIIWPNQGSMVLSSTYVPYVYSTFFLIIMYEETTMQKNNVCIFINDFDQGSTIIESSTINGINPINTSSDVACSIMNNAYCENTHTEFYPTLEANSSLYNLGTITPWPTCGIGMLGSFNYNNNTLYGIGDDTNDNIVNGMDALINLKNYLPNLSANFKLTQSTNSIGNYSIWLSNILAYSTPCPARSFADTIVKHTICQGQSISLNTQSIGNSYSWYPKQSLNDSTIANPIATPTTTTNYIVSIDSAGCKHTEQVQVAVTPIPQADTIFASNNVCGGPSGRIIIKPGHGPYEPYTYSLNGGANINDTTFTNLNGGNYNVLITDTRGCTWQSNVITINNTIGVNASFNTQTASSSAIAPLYVSFTNGTSGATNYNWYFPTTTSSTYNSNYTFTEAGTYTVTLIAYNNLQQCADTATKIIVVLPQDTAGIFIPNVFSPNGDGVNDNYELKIKNAELEVYEMYNRWGVLVSTALDLTKSNIGNVTHFTWTGRTTSGIECSAGTYFYVIKVKLDSAFSKEGTKEFKGFVTLVK